MTIETFLKSYDPKVQDICAQLRKLANALLPETEEILFEGWKNFAYGINSSKSDKDLIIYVAPFKDSVNLGFYRGTLLQDKKHLLKGTGKQMRHVKIKAMSDIELDDIKTLILEAKAERMGNV